MLTRRVPRFAFSHDAGTALTRSWSRARAARGARSFVIAAPDATTAHRPATPFRTAAGTRRSRRSTTPDLGSQS